jgi:hypothetical protein
MILALIWYSRSQLLVVQASFEISKIFLRNMLTAQLDQLSGVRQLQIAHRFFDKPTDSERSSVAPRQINICAQLNTTLPTSWRPAVKTINSHCKLTVPKQLLPKPAFPSRSGPITAHVTTELQGEQATGTWFLRYSFAIFYHSMRRPDRLVEKSSHAITNLGELDPGVFC